MFPTFRKYFTTGLLVLLPMAATVWVIMILANWIDGYILTHAFNLIKKLDPNEVWNPIAMKWMVGIVAIVLSLLAVLALGGLTRNAAGRFTLRLMDTFFTRVPLANKVYIFVKGLIDTISLAGGGHFERVVAIEYPRKGVHSIGFVSRTMDETFLKGSVAEKVAIFVPTSPNPTSGFIIVADVEDTVPLDLTPEDALKFIVSGGVVLPDVADKARNP